MLLRFGCSLLVLLAVAGSVCAQTTIVTATVVDPNGIAYANGTVSAFLQVPTGVIPKLSGAPVNPSSGPFAMNSAGSFSISLADNTQIVPSPGTQWTFKVCAPSVSLPQVPSVGICFDAGPIFISGFTQTITATLNAAAKPLGISATALGTSSISGFALVDGVINTSIAAAVATLPSTGGVVISNRPETFTASLSAAIGTKKVRIMLGNGIWTTNAGQIIPIQSQLIGSGPGATVLIAGPSFPTGSSVVTLGVAAQPGNNIRVEEMTVDCNNVGTCTGVTYAQGQEQSGVRNVVVLNYNVNCINVTGATAQNSFADRLICGYGSSATTTTTSVVVNGVPSFKLTRDSTITQNAAPVSTPAKAIQIAGGQTGEFSDIHIESHTTGISVEGSSSLIISNIYGHSTLTTLVSIDSASFNVSLFALTKNGGTNILVDSATVPNVTSTLTGLGYYLVGDGSLGTRPRISSAVTIPSITSLGGGVTFATLNTLAPGNGTVMFCNDCNATCTAGASAGRTCFRENNAWTH